MQFLKWVIRIIGFGLYSIMMAILIAFLVVVMIVAIVTYTGQDIGIEDAVPYYEETEQYEPNPSFDENPGFYNWDYSEKHV